MKLSPYLSFKGSCKEAITTYADILDGEIKLMMPYSEAPEGEFPVTEEMKDLIMHCTLEFDGKTIHACDNMQCNIGNNFSLSLNTDDEDQAIKIFESLSENGKIIMPLNDVFWGGKFGMLEDQYGVQWMMSVDQEAS